ncbi:MAG: lamin tail domain-containing protein [Ignavibacteriae bacterium]|nr:lamin tail domain-containing protein [Ignavibacteriota bacterium]
MKIIIVFLIPFIANSQIIINEFMPYPLSGNPEWLELYNPDSINTWSIAALWIEDATNRIKIENIDIPPKKYLIITRDTNTLKNSINPIQCLLRQAVLPTLNNSKDKIILRNQDSTVIDSIAYTISKEQKGKSLERYKNSTSSNDLITTIHPNGHTCGFINSILPLDTGTSNVKSYLDILMTHQISEIGISVSELQISKGMNQISITSSHLLEDPRLYNNNGVFEYYQSFPNRSIIINEINVHDNYFPEFIEIRILDKSINLQDGYTCIIGRDTIDLSLEDNSEYVLITKEPDTRLLEHLCIYDNSFSLSNEGIKIQIIDPNGLIIDSINYDYLILKYSSFLPNSSFEYSDSLNGGTWFISMNELGGTPGKMNSPIQSSNTKDITIEYEGCNGSFMNCQQIRIKQPFTIGIYSCDVYTLDGFFISSIFVDKLIPTETVFPFYDMIDLPSSAYILVHRIKDYQGIDSISKITPFIKRN